MTSNLNSISTWARREGLPGWGILNDAHIIPSRPGGGCLITDGYTDMDRFILIKLRARWPALYLSITDGFVNMDKWAEIQSMSPRRQYEKPYFYVLTTDGLIDMDEYFMMSSGDRERAPNLLTTDVYVAMDDYDFMLASMHQELGADALDLYEKVLSPLSEDLRNRILQPMRYCGSNIKKAVKQVLLEDLESRRRQQGVLRTIDLLQASIVRESTLPTPKDLSCGQGMSMEQVASLEVHGTLNETAVVAVADTGSCFNLISERRATSMGLTPLAGTQGPMTLPNGSNVMSPGYVQLAFSFDGETEKHDLICSILPGATRDLVLGSLFLKATRTMTDFAHRIKRIIRCLANPSLNLIGAEQDFLGGYINGTECLAVPDTGSDVMAISLKHARKLGLKVHRRERHRTLVEFLDGSRVLTNGVAQTDWQFAYGEPTIRCDFHVIKGLPVDAILSNTLLDEHDAFSRYEERIQSAERLNSTMGLGIYGISLVEVCEQKLRSLSDSYLDDIKSDNPFTRDKVERERARRDEIRDAIAQIPDEALRATKQHQEYLRKRLWDELRKPHLEANVSTGTAQDKHSIANHRNQGSRDSYWVPKAIRSNNQGARQLEEGLTVDDSNSSQPTQRSWTGFKALRRFFR